MNTVIIKTPIMSICHSHNINTIKKCGIYFEYLPIKLDHLRHFLLKSLYQASKVSSHVCYVRSYHWLNIQKQYFSISTIFCLT